MILLVDDDIDFLFQHKTILENEGYEVVTAESQKETENIISKLKPDLAIFDLMLESKDSGFALAYKLKKLYPQVPVIIYTSVLTKTGYSFDVNTEEDKKWIKADRYFDKSIDRENLIKAIETLLENQ